MMKFAKLKTSFRAYHTRALLLLISIASMHVALVGQANFGGYLKNMQSAIFPGNDIILMENLIHHRLNFTYQLHPNLQFAAGLRNRVFAGNFTALQFDLKEQLKAASDDFIPLSFLWANRGAFAAHSTLDRLNLEYNKGKWNFRIGRQRINWGINLAFNPNDLFNAFNFLDFDYEERPGADALRIQYYYDFASGIDFVHNPGDHKSKGGTAFRWFFNERNFDFQLISGVVRSDLIFGGGWAGHIKNAGWKGEFSFFEPLLNQQRQRAFTASTGIDYTFGKGWMLYGAYLFNSDVSSSGNPLAAQNMPLSARNLYPFQHNVLAQAGYPITPLVQISLATIYSVDSDHPLVLSPSVKINLNDNWDLDCIGQHFLPLGKNANFDGVSLVFLRLRWSY